MTEEKEGEEESTDKKPDIYCIEREEEESILTFWVDSCSWCIVGNNSDVSKHDSYEAKGFYSWKYFDSFVISLRLGLEKSEGGEERKYLDILDVNIDFFNFFKKVNGRADNQ